MLNKRHVTPMYFIPGPSNLDSEFINQISDISIPHYGDEFLALWNNVRESLALLARATNKPILFSGSGTAGTDMLGNSLYGQTVIVLSNGFFAERMADIFLSHGVDVIKISLPPRSAIDPDYVSQIIVRYPDTFAVACVHVESSTGVQNPIDKIATLVKNHNKFFFVDAVSSLGVTQVNFDENNIDYLWSASQKGLASPIGMAVVFYSDNFQNYVLNRTQSQSSSWYLNIKNWFKAENELKKHPFPVSIPSFIIAYLYQHLTWINFEKFERYLSKLSEISKQVTTAFCKLGFQLFTINSTDAASCILVLEHDIDFPSESMRSFLRKECGIVIAGSLLGKKPEIGCGAIIRVGLYGRQVFCEEKIQHLINSISKFKGQRQ